MKSDGSMILRNAMTAFEHMYIPLGIEWLQGEPPDWLGPVDMAVRHAAKACQVPRDISLAGSVAHVILRLDVHVSCHARPIFENLPPMVAIKHDMCETAIDSVTAENEFGTSEPPSRQAGFDFAGVLPMNGLRSSPMPDSGSTHNEATMVGCQQTPHNLNSVCNSGSSIAGNEISGASSGYNSTASLCNKQPSGFARIMSDIAQFSISLTHECDLRAAPARRCFADGMVIDFACIHKVFPGPCVKLVYISAAFLLECAVLTWQPGSHWHEIETPDDNCTQTVSTSGTPIFHRNTPPILYIALSVNQAFLILVVCHMYNKAMLIACLKTFEPSYIMINFGFYWVAFCHSEFVLADASFFRYFWLTVGLVLYGSSMLIGLGLLTCCEAMVVLRKRQKFLFIFSCLVHTLVCLFHDHLSDDYTHINLCYGYTCTRLKSIMLSTLGSIAVMQVKLLTGYITGHEFLLLKPYFVLQSVPCLNRQSTLEQSESMIDYIKSG